MDEIEVAIFAIPGAVSFPLSRMPLHVFEPRYRTLIKDSVRMRRRVAVCHTKKLIHPAKPGQTTEEILSRNQGIYEPYRIFAAGFAQIDDTTEDGRILVEIAMDGRYEAIDEIQTLPYRVFRCRRYDDAPDESADVTQALRSAIDRSLVRISRAASDEMRGLLEGEAWRAQPIEEYSFKIFQFIRFEPDVMQNVLEMRSPRERLRFLANALGPEAP